MRAPGFGRVLVGSRDPASASVDELRFSVVNFRTLDPRRARRRGFVVVEGRAATPSGAGVDDASAPRWRTDRHDQLRWTWTFLLVPARPAGPQTRVVFGWRARVAPWWVRAFTSPADRPRRRRHVPRHAARRAASRGSGRGRLIPPPRGRDLSAAVSPVGPSPRAEFYLRDRRSARQSSRRQHHRRLVGRPGWRRSRRLAMSAATLAHRYATSSRSALVRPGLAGGRQEIVRGGELVTSNR